MFEFNMVTCKKDDGLGRKKIIVVYGQRYKCKLINWQNCKPLFTSKLQKQLGTIRCDVVFERPVEDTNVNLRIPGICITWSVYCVVHDWEEYVPQMLRYTECRSDIRKFGLLNLPYYHHFMDSENALKPDRLEQI